MTRSKTPDLIEAEAALVTSGIALQTQSLALLLAEMQALSDLFASPALGRIKPADPADPSVRARAEAETEAGFDNMPV
jgi:hypothetical protein